MNKEFIPYEQALALKELGFDESCFGSYDPFGSKQLSYSGIYTYGNCIAAPLYQQAFRWFREKHDLQASNIMFSNGKYDTGITRYKGTQSVWGNGPIYDTFEEAELACLIKLIEIVKINNNELDL
jgi:hypothetical protein